MASIMSTLLELLSVSPQLLTSVVLVIAILDVAVVVGPEIVGGARVTFVSLALPAVAAFVFDSPGPPRVG